MAVIGVNQIDAIGVEGKNLKLLIIDYLIENMKTCI